MKTVFYKILYKNKRVVYVGVTTRSISERFKEHILTKSLDPNNYNIVKFDEIEHGEINSLEKFYEERSIVANLEQKYIREEYELGAKLLNLSNGGEWGSQILCKLRKEEFLCKFGSYDNYKVHVKLRTRFRTWITFWIIRESEAPLKRWVRHWVDNKGNSNVRVWLYNWVHNKSRSKSKTWLHSWVSHKGACPFKSWVNHWISVKKIPKLKKWFKNWAYKKY